ncbi:uncharacterized protein UHOD_06297 [Ustilago sp. UG-2017b]|nr:uncharacterized protein UHOD_06297 [Ustilago sp. UG-2017b]
MSQQASASTDASAGSSSYTKYASLPDVDTSAPDVYESIAPMRTSDPSHSSRRQKSTGNDDFDSDSSSDDSDRIANRKHPGDGKVNEDIDATSLKRNDAAAKFSGATDVPTEKADFSGRLQRRSRKTRPRGAGLETSTYVIHGSSRVGTGEKESAVDRLRRLKFEASQLEEELSASAGKGTEEGLKENVDSAEVLAQLKVLQDQLANLASPSTATAISTTSEKDALRSLLQQVKQPPQTSSSGPSAPTTAPTATASGSTADIVALETGLSELESSLGLPSALLDDSHPLPRPILSTLSRLEHQLSLLSQPRHLDAISRRVKVLVTEMDRVHDTRRKLADLTTTDRTTSSSTLTKWEVEKLQQLFEVSTRLEPLLPIIPGVLGRLETLAELHATAAHFGSTLDEMEESQEARLREQEELEELLGKMEKNMEETRGRVESNLDSVIGRIEGLRARLEELS